MDVFSHGLWGAAAMKALNLKRKTQHSLVWAAFWGMFPDLFAFAPTLALRFFQGTGFGPPTRDPAGMMLFPGISLALSLYNVSHSLVIFLGVAGIYFVLRKRVPWVLIGWPLHILLDIPTHEHRFFPTPFLWPIPHPKVDGISWGTPWILIPNYLLIIAVFIALAVWEKRLKRPR